jgi:hypothetical protein
MQSSAAQAMRAGKFLVIDDPFSTGSPISLTERALSVRD